MYTIESRIYCPECDLADCLVVTNHENEVILVSCPDCGYDGDAGDSLVLEDVRYPIHPSVKSFMEAA